MMLTDFVSIWYFVKLLSVDRYTVAMVIRLNTRYRNVREALFREIATLAILPLKKNVNLNHV